VAIAELAVARPVAAAATLVTVTVGTAALVAARPRAVAAGAVAVTVGSAPGAVARPRAVAAVVELVMVPAEPAAAARPRAVAAAALTVTVPVAPAALARPFPVAAAAVIVMVPSAPVAAARPVAVAAGAVAVVVPMAPVAVAGTVGVAVGCETIALVRDCVLHVDVCCHVAIDVPTLPATVVDRPPISMRYSSTTTYSESALAAPAPKFQSKRSAVDAMMMGSGKTHTHPLPAVAGMTTRRRGTFVEIVGATDQAVTMSDVAAGSDGSFGCIAVVVDAVPFVAARTSCALVAVAALRNPPISLTRTRSVEAARIAANAAAAAAAGVVTEAL